MASVPSSGPISFTDIQAVMGGSGPISIQDYIQSAATGYAKGVPGIGDTNLNIADFQGKSKALVSGLQYRLFRKRYTFSNATSGSAGTGSLYGGGGGAGGVTVTDYASALTPSSSATVATGTFSGGAGTAFGAGGGGTGTMVARYIRFQYATTSTSARYMNLAGVKVYTSLAGSNIINSSMATSALDYHPAPFLPSYLVDNNDNTMYHAGGDPNPWVMVDLGSEQFIYKVELTNRIDCCRFRIGGLTLQLRNNSGTTIYTSGMCALPNGSTVYEGSSGHMDGYLYYNWWPAVNTTPYGSDSTPYAPSPLFSAGQGASGFAYIQPPILPSTTITARYLTFEYGNSGAGRYIQSSGVRVYGSLSGTNIITPSMTVTASSVLSSSFVTAYMVDNNDTTTYISVNTDYPWVKIDLGSEQPIHRVELMNRFDCCQSRLAGIRLVLSNTSNTIVYTSGLITNKSGSATYQDGENAFMYYTFWPAITTAPAGSDTVPYPATEFFTNVSSSYTFPIAGTAKLLLMGGGGGGGSNAGTNSRGGGGGGAGYLQSYFIPVTSGMVATLTVGGPGTPDVSGGTTSAVVNSITYTAAGGGNGATTQTGGAGSAAGGTGGSAAQASGGGRSFMKARYVLFDFGNGNGGVSRYLHFMTVRVYSTANGPNITTPTMTVSASQASGAANIIDNDDTTYWHSEASEYPWIMVDLGSEQFIHKVELMNRTDCCRGRIAGARLVLRNNSGTAIYTSNLMTLKNGSTTYQEWPGNDGFLYYNWWPAANTNVYGSDTTPYADIAMNQSGAPAIGHLTNDGGYFADDTTWFDSRTENYPAGLVTNFTNINTATDGIVPTDSSWQTYSVEWFGYFFATVTGTYTFFTNTDDASYLWVGASALSGYTTSNCLVNNGGIHAVQERSGTISLTAGTYYPIRFQFGQNTSGDGCALSFSAPGIARTYNLSGYVYYGIGTYSSFPINHARLLRATNAATVDRSYFVNVNGTATPTYCLMDSKWDGGGWMMMLKATAGTATLTALTNITENSSAVQTSIYMGSIPLPAGFVTGSSIAVTMTGTRAPNYGYIEGGSYIQDATDTIRFIQLVYGDAGRSGAATISGTATASFTASMFPLKAYKYSAYPGWSVSTMTLNVTITYSNTTAGTVFPYSSTYWTDATTTLNTGSTDRTAADSKFAVMNRTPIKDVLALWPDAGITGGSISQTEAWSWMVNNYYYGGARVTPIVGFSSSNSRDATTHFLNTSDQTSFAGYSASIWSQQAGAKRHVFGGGTHLSANANVRWGFLWNNENDFATVDVSGGLGMSHMPYSAGDYYGGAGTSVLNRSMRVEMYGR